MSIDARVSIAWRPALARSLTTWPLPSCGAAYLARPQRLRDDNQANDLLDGWGAAGRVNEKVDAGQPWKLIIAEDRKNDGWVTRPAGDGGAGFDSQWDPSFVADVRAQLRPAQDTGRSMAAIAGALTRRYSDRPLARVVFTESHDEDGNNGGRLPHDIDPQHPDSVWAKKRSTLGAAIMFTARHPDDVPGPGDPRGPLVHPRPDPTSRLGEGNPLQGHLDAVPGPHPATPQRDVHDGWAARRRVQVHHLNDIYKVTAYHRWADGGPRDDMLVVANFAIAATTPTPLACHAAARGDAHLQRRRRYDGEFDGHCPRAIPALDQDYDGMSARTDLPLGR